MGRTVHIRRPTDAGFRGVSLLELCVVVAVMLVVAASSLPAVMTVMQQYRLRMATKDVAAMLQRSRMRCVRDNRSYSVLEAQTTHGGHTYNQLFLDQNGNSSFDSGEAIVQLPNGVRFNSSSAPALSAVHPGLHPAAILDRAQLQWAGPALCGAQRHLHQLGLQRQRRRRGLLPARFAPRQRRLGGGDGGPGGTGAHLAVLGEQFAMAGTVKESL